MQKEKNLHLEEEGNYGYHKKPINFFNKENFTITIVPEEEYPHNNNNIINVEEDEKDDVIYLTISSESEEYKHIKYTAKVYIDDEIENQPDFQKCYEDVELDEIGVELAKYFDDNQYEIQKGKHNNQIILIFKYMTNFKKKQIQSQFQFELSLQNAQKNSVELDFQKFQQKQTGLQKQQFQEMKNYFDQKFEDLKQQQQQQQQQKEEPKQNGHNIDEILEKKFTDLTEKLFQNLQNTNNNSNQNLKVIENLERKIENLSNLFEKNMQNQSEKENLPDSKEQQQQQQKILDVLENININQQNGNESQDIIQIKEKKNSEYEYYAGFSPDKEIFDKSEEQKWIHTKQDDKINFPYVLDLNQFHKRNYHNKNQQPYGIKNDIFVQFQADFYISDSTFNYQFIFAFDEDVYKSDLEEENKNQKRYSQVEVYSAEMEVIKLF